MNPLLENVQNATRRHFLKQTFAGIGGFALGSLVNPASASDLPNPLAPKKPHFPAKRNVSSTCT